MNTIKNPFALSPSKDELPQSHSCFDRLMELLAIRLGCQKTTAKSLVIATNGFKLCRQSGFTLLEVLVALAILAITMAAVSRTASSSIHHVEALRTRVIADWVAQNRLAQHQARGDYPQPGIQNWRGSPSRKKLPVAGRSHRHSQPHHAPHCRQRVCAGRFETYAARVDRVFGAVSEVTKKCIHHLLHSNYSGASCSSFLPSSLLESSGFPLLPPPSYIPVRLLESRMPSRGSSDTNLKMGTIRWNRNIDQRVSIGSMFLGRIVLS